MGKKNKKEKFHIRAYCYFYFEYFYCCSNGASWIYFYEIATTYPTAQKLREYFLRNFSCWCALNTVVYRSFALRVKPEIHCLDVRCAGTFCKPFVLGRSKGASGCRDPCRVWIGRRCLRGLFRCTVLVICSQIDGHRPGLERDRPAECVRSWFCLQKREPLQFVSTVQTCGGVPKARDRRKFDPVSCVTWRLR